MDTIDDSSVNIEGNEHFYLFNKNFKDILSTQDLEEILSYISTIEFHRLQFDAALRVQIGEKFITSGEYSSAIELTYIDLGQESLIFQFILNNKKFVLKVHNKLLLRKGLINSYMEEMQRIDKLNEIKDELAKYNVFIPQIYFASVNFEIREYIDGENLTVSEAGTTVNDIERILEEWLDTKKGKEFRHIELDLRDMLNHPAGKNFIKTSDGQIYLVDPFKVNESE